MRTNALQAKKALLALFAMLVPMLTSAHDFEVDGIYYKITSTSDLTVAVTYKGSSYGAYTDEYSGVVTIPTNVTYSSKSYRVTSIGNSAFYGCNNLTSITLPENSQLTYIGDDAFYECSNLTSIIIPDGVTSIGEAAFYGCSSLTSITVPESVVNIGFCAFYDTAWYENQPDGVVYVGKVLCDYKGDMPENTSIVVKDGTKGIGDYAFSGCSSLTAITIPEDVTSIGRSAFSGCSSLTAITLPEGVTSIGESAFDECINITSITLPASVVSIDRWAFYRCSSLTSITIPENSQLASIGERAFFYCESLTSITLPESVTSIGDAVFSGCISLTDIVVAEGNAVYDSRNGCNAIIKTASNSLIVGCSTTIIPESVTSIGWGAFQGCSSLTSITIPENVASISVRAFESCSGLTSIAIPEGVTSIEDMTFFDCSSLTSITLPNGLTRIKGSAFQGCSSLTSIILPEGVKSIDDGAFYNCSSLTFIIIPHGVTSIEYSTFTYYESLTSITLPEGVTSIGDHAFEGCYSLTSITLPESVTRIGWGAFAGCISLTSITIPDGVTSIESETFSYCESLTSITLPDGVTSIGYEAFSYCKSLTSITIPENVTRIGWEAFAECGSLTSITSKAEIPPTIYNSTVFAGVDKNIPVYVPAGSVEAYQSAKYWKEFTNIQPIVVPTTVTITINQYGSGTYSSPYALDFRQVTGLKAYVATGYNPESEVVTLLRVNTAKAGVGLLIKGAPGTYEVPMMEISNDNTLNLLVATTTPISVNSKSNDGVYANYKYTIKEGDAEPKFYPFADGSTMGAGKAYLQIPVAWLPTNVARSIGLRFDDGEGTTDMENSEFTIDNSQLTIIYDLYGRRVTQPVKGSMYIVNGRKVVF